ncbi:MAG: Ig-like domain-containing protein [Anaerovoracaceae bacterium]
MSTTRRRIWIPGILALLLVLSLIPSLSFADDEVEWWNFRNNYENNGVTDRATPNDAKIASLKWGVKVGTGWGASPTPPVIVNGSPYVGAGNKIYKLDRETGEILQTSDEMVGYVGYAMNPIVYAEGVFYVQVGNGTIQAMDATTLKPLWSTKKLGGQTISPIAYRQIDGKGYLYLGTWTGESRDGTFFAVTTTDEDPGRGDEVKDPVWTFVPAEDDSALADHPKKNRGFYWAGAYATEKYVAVGSDDGTSEGDYTANAVFYTLNPKTGAIIDRLDGVKGDIRTTVVYDNGHLYFSTKGGELYRVPVDENGKLGTADKIQLGGMTTASPVVYKNKIYIGVAGPGGQFSPDGGHRFAVIKNLPGEAMVEEHGLPIPGYPQAAALLSTAYENKDFNGDGSPDGRVYIYFTYNAPPGGLYYTYYQPGMTQAPEAKPLFIPPADMQQYCISTICADKDGTMYYKNDSGHIMAVETNPAYLDGATVTPDVGEATWSQNFDGGINQYTVKVKPENNKVKLNLTMPEGANATVNETPYVPATGMDLTLDGQGRYEAAIKVTKGNHSRIYTILVERESQVATLKSLRVNGSNNYSSMVYDLIPGFNKDIHEYSTALLPQNKDFYNVWPDGEHPDAKVQVFPVKNVDTSDASEFIEETGEFKPTGANQGHTRYAVYAEDKKLDSEVLIRVTSESGQFSQEYKLTLSRTVNVADVDLEPKTVEIVKGETATLTPIFNPSNASITDVTWSSADENIATVDKGVVTGVAHGQTTVTVTTVDGGKTAQATIKVTSLDDYKTSAKAVLDEYKDPADYRPEQKVQLAAAIASGKAAIDEAGTVEAVDGAVSEAKAAMDEIKTDAQLTEEEVGAAAAVDEKILAIGEVTLNSEEAIAEARGAYEALSEGAKAKVTKLAVLEAAEEKLAQLKAQTLQEAKTAAKTELDNYKNADDYRPAEKIKLAAAISEGKESIDEATDIQGVNDALTAAKATIDEIKTDDQLSAEEARAVDEKIQAIGEVTLDREEAIAEARAAYEALTDGAKAKVTKLAVLEAAEERLAQLKAAELQEAKAAAKAQLDSYDLDDYQDAQKAEVRKAIDDGKAAIDAATTVDGVTKALNDAKNVIGRIPTKADIQLEKDTEITVYVTMAKDGTFLVGKDSSATELGAVPFKVGYFDLKQYGLEKYYRYEAASFEEGGAYINDTIVKKPTVLHALIRFTEKYYLNGEKLTVPSEGLTVGGNATGMFMNKLFGEDYNMNYYVNHKYPLMGPGWGATADYILLENNDKINVGWFTDPSFWMEGASFMHFDGVEKTVEVGKPLDSVIKGTGYGENYTTVSIAKKGESILVDGEEKTKSGEDGEFTLTFDQPGTYYVTSSSVSPNNKFLVPAAMKVTVTEKSMDTLKEEAKAQLDNHKDPADYRDAQKAELAGAIADGKAAIDSAGTPEGIDTAVAAAKAVMDKIKTDAELSQEETEAAAAVDEKIQAIGEVTLEKKAEIQAARGAYEALPQLAKDKVTKLALLEAAEAKLAQLEAAEALARAKTAAKGELDNYKDSANYREAQKAELEAAIAEGKTAIDEATDVEGVNAAASAAKAVMDGIKTDAELLQEEAQGVDQMIEAIGEVTLEKKAEIQAAREAYEGLADGAKAKVTKLAVLEAAEAKLAQLEAAAAQEELDKAAAKAVEDKIAAIGTVDLSKEEIIAKARAAFDGLTPAQKAFVPNEALLTAAEERIAQLLGEPLIQIDYENSSQTNEAHAFLWVKGESEKIKVRVLADFDTFLEKIVVDGKNLDPNNYTVSDGSILIQFDRGYLNGLTNGEHKFQVYTKNGFAAGTILVSAKEQPPVDPDDPGNPVDPDKPIVDPDKPSDKPSDGGKTDVDGKSDTAKDGKSSGIKPTKTGDSASTGIIWLTALLALVLCAAAVGPLRKNRKTDR